MKKENGLVYDVEISNVPQDHIELLKGAGFRFFMHCGYGKAGVRELKRFMVNGYEMKVVVDEWVLNMLLSCEGVSV